MKVAVFSTKPYDRSFLAATSCRHEFTFLEPRLAPETAKLAAGFPAVCVFVNDQLDTTVLKQLADQGTKLIALRCAGFSNVDLAAARDFGLTVVRVPGYSPHAVAEHTVTLILALNRKIHRSHARAREGNFELSGLMGFDLYGRTVGIVGTGKIGTVVARIMHGFGCRLLANDVSPNSACVSLGTKYVPLSTLLSESDIISLHCPLTPETHHLIDADALNTMKTGVMLINTSRGAVIETKVVVDALKSGKLGYLGLDVYEEEADVFFQDLSNDGIQDDLLARLLTFPNVLITGHQGFFTHEALQNIADTTRDNISRFEGGSRCDNEVTVENVQ